MIFSGKGPKALLVACCLASVTACGGPSYDQNGAAPKPSHAQTTRRIPAMSADVHKDLQKAQEALDAKDYSTVEAILLGLMNRERINGYEQAVVWQFKAQLAYEQDDLDGTIHAYEQILAQADYIPEALETGIIYSLSQLYYSKEDWDIALTYVTQWERQVRPDLISVSNQQYIASLHYVRADYPKALTHIYRAIDTAESLPGIKVKESWYQMALSAHWEMGDIDKTATVLERLLHLAPSPRYCMMLAGTYMELGMPNDEALQKLAATVPACSGTRETALPDPPQIPDAEPMRSARRDDQRSPLPLVRVQPQYPRKAYEEKVTGYVIVELTILPDGNVDPGSLLIVEAEPSGYFEAAAISAASKFKFLPRVIDGVPQKVTGVKYRFSWDFGN